LELRAWQAGTSRRTDRSSLPFGASRLRVNSDSDRFAVASAVAGRYEEAPPTTD
jgi:hypothetical protein